MRRAFAQADRFTSTLGEGGGGRTGSGDSTDSAVRCVALSEHLHSVVAQAVLTTATSVRPTLGDRSDSNHRSPDRHGAFPTNHKHLSPEHRAESGGPMAPKQS